MEQKTQGHFKGTQPPLGTEVVFLPNPVIEDEKPRFVPRGIPGVFLGWKMNPGGRWSGEY